MCRLRCRPRSPWPLCRCAPCLQAAVWSPVAPVLDPLPSHPTCAGCCVVPGRPSPSAVVPHTCRVWCHPLSPRRWPLCCRAPCVQAAVSSLVAPALAPLPLSPTCAGCGVVPGRPGPSAVEPHACRVQCRPWSPRPVCCHAPCVQAAVSSPVALALAPLPLSPTCAGCGVVPGRPGPSAVEPHACRVQCRPWSPRPVCCHAPCVQAAVWSPVALARLLSHPMCAGCSVVPGRPGLSAVTPHACRLRCGPWSPRRWPLCRRAPRVQAAVSSPVAVSGQQCSREFLLPQPTSPGPPSLERGAGPQPGRRPGFSASWQGHTVPAWAMVEKWLWGTVFSVPHNCQVICMDSDLTRASPADVLVTVPCLRVNM